MTVIYACTRFIVIAKGYCQSAASVKLKHTWQRIPCLLQINNGRLPTGSYKISIMTVVEAASGKGHA